MEGNTLEVVGSRSISHAKNLAAGCPWSPLLMMTVMFAGMPGKQDREVLHVDDVLPRRGNDAMMTRRHDPV